MNSVNLGPLLSFVFITTFTPGPTNITSSSMGILYGYKKSVNFVVGCVIGLIGIMLVCGIISRTLYSVFPAVKSIMRLVGAAYILWLAYKTLASSYQFSVKESPVLGFRGGVILQILNPKVWIFGLTLYTTFLASITGNLLLLGLSAVILGADAFCAISTWAISGAAIRRFVAQPRLQRLVNTILALLLAYTALELSGLF